MTGLGTSGATHNITGYVKSEVNDEPISGARMRLMTLDNNVAHGAILSSPTGEFSFRGFPAGDYYIEVEKPDYEPARVRVTIATHGDLLLIHLRPSPPVRTNGSSNAGLTRSAAVPEKALDAYEKGVALLRAQSDYHGAIAQFERAIKSYPGYYEAYAQMGVAHDRLGDKASAEEALRKSIEMSSGKYAEPFFLLAEILNDESKFAEAEKLARQGTTAEGNSPRGHYELARALAGLKRDAEAEQSAVKAREITPDSPSVHLLLANIHRRLHNYQAVLQDLDAYLTLAPTGPASDQARALRQQVQKALQGEPN